MYAGVQQLRARTKFVVNVHVFVCKALTSSPSVEKRTAPIVLLRAHLPVMNKPSQRLLRALVTIGT